MINFVPIVFKGYILLVSSDFVLENNTYAIGNATKAQEFAEKYKAILPTPELVDEINNKASCKPESLILDPADESSLEKNNQYIINSIAECSDKSLIAGHKKTLVQSTVINRAAIYGWVIRGQKIQSYSTVHDLEYYDYSQGIRLVAKYAIDKDNNLVDANSILTCKTDKCGDL